MKTSLSIKTCSDGPGFLWSFRYVASPNYAILWLGSQKSFERLTMLSKEMRTRVTLKLNLWTVVIFHCRPFYFFSFFAHEHYGNIGSGVSSSGMLNYIDFWFGNNLAVLHFKRCKIFIWTLSFFAKNLTTVKSRAVARLG